jgi:hypothetical protein
MLCHPPAERCNSLMPSTDRDSAKFGFISTLFDRAVAREILACARP